MHKVIAITATLLLAGSIAVAQSNTTPDEPNSQQAPTTSPDQQHRGTISQAVDERQNSLLSGCLNGSDGNFTLTADDGTTYRLTGAISGLSQYVGHKVQLAGTSTTADANASASSQAQPATPTEKAFTVTNAEEVSATCQSAPLGPGVSSSSTTGGVSGAAAGQQSNQATPPVENTPVGDAAAGVANPNPSNASPKLDPKAYEQNPQPQPTGTAMPNPPQPIPRPQDQTPSPGPPHPTTGTTTTNPSTSTPPPQI